MMNLFSKGIVDLLRGDPALFEESLEDFEGPAFEVFFRLFVKITVLANQMDQRIFVQFHGLSPKTL